MLMVNIILVYPKDDLTINVVGFGCQKDLFCTNKQTTILMQRENSDIVLVHNGQPADRLSHYTATGGCFLNFFLVVLYELNNIRLC